MALERRDSAGGAVDTTITAGINGTDLSISIASSTGWPSGGANGPFFVIVDYDVAGKEKIEVASRTGTTLTIANTGKRGVDGTVAATHASGAKIRHCFTRQDADEANYTMSQTVGKVTTKGDQIVATGANAFGRLPLGANNTVMVADSAQATGTKWATLTSASLAADSVGSTQIQADAVGASELADNAVDTNAIANLAVTAAKIANDTITATQIAADAVGASELANNAVDAGAIAAGAVTAGKIAAGGVSATNQIADAIITLAKMANDAPLTHGTGANGGANIWNNVTLGSGADTYAKYFKIGFLVVGFCGFSLGVGGNVTGTLQYSIPTVPSDFFAPANVGTGLVVGRVVSAGTAWSGLGAVLDAGSFRASDFITAGGANAWGSTANNPAAWGTGSIFQSLFIYISST